MVHEHLKGLRLDRRALGRRGWISADDLSAELAGLPDVASKIAEPEPEAGEPAAAAGAADEGSGK